ncbi:unnamed protein product [Fraxinus pennsylvanica]|uniref:Uncharacterized protein n=1 Tax=Fraxinus pennsylvanica TaxID=56036 RepID=A0AAD1ZGG4_9LAMI|nr:unnamed protein product [Fraxinus pennsylvanica]
MASILLDASKQYYATSSLLVGYALCSSLLAVINKFAITKFNSLGLLTTLQYLTSALGVWILGKLGLPTKLKPGKPKPFTPFFPKFPLDSPHSKPIHLRPKSGEPNGGQLQNLVKRKAEHIVPDNRAIYINHFCGTFLTLNGRQRYLTKNMKRLKMQSLLR